MIHHCLPFKRGNPTSAYRRITRTDSTSCSSSFCSPIPPKYTRFYFYYVHSREHCRTLCREGFCKRREFTREDYGFERERERVSATFQLKWRKTHRDSAEWGDIAVSRCCSSSSRSKIPGNFQRCTCSEWRIRLPVSRSWNCLGRSRTGSPRWHYCCRICSTPSPVRIWSAHVDDACSYDPRTWNETRRIIKSRNTARCKIESITNIFEKNIFLLLNKLDWSDFS